MPPAGTTPPGYRQKRWPRRGCAASAAPNLAGHEAEEQRHAANHPVGDRSKSACRGEAILPGAVEVLGRVVEQRPEARVVEAGQALRIVTAAGGGDEPLDLVGDRGRVVAGR